MNTSHPITLREAQSNKVVAATLWERVDTAYAKRADDSWSTYIAIEEAAAITNGRVFKTPEHGHWEWEKKVKLTEKFLPYPTLGIDIDGEIQGLMMLKTDGDFCRLDEQAKRPLVQVYFLSTAPWNLASVASQPRYKGVGLALMWAAAQHSVDLGFKGRIGLHSLPQAETFYERIGMTCLGPDSKKQDLKYFEMTEAQAARFLT